MSAVNVVVAEKSPDELQDAQAKAKKPLRRLFCTSALILLLVGAFYGYRMQQQAGGWWNPFAGKSFIPHVALHHQGHGPAMGADCAGG
jgi:hypothetical protein